MSDNITLPREVVEKALEALDSEHPDIQLRAAIALRTALAAEPKQEPVAKAWAEGYQQGVKDERTSEASIGIAGFGAKVEPARQNPYGTALAAEQPKPSEDVEALRRDAYQGGWLREWLDSNGLLARAIRGESLAGYEHPDIKALRRENERLREEVRVLRLYGNKDCTAMADEVMKEAALRREET